MRNTEPQLIQTLGILNTVYIDSIVGEKNLDYLEYVVTYCQNSHLNNFWYAKQASQNKSINYQNNLNIAITSEVNDKAQQLKLLKQGLKRKQQQVRSHKDQVIQIKDYYKRFQLQLERTKYQNKMLHLQKVLQRQRRKTQQQYYQSLYSIPPTMQHTDRENVVPHNATQNHSLLNNGRIQYNNHPQSMNYLHHPSYQISDPNSRNHSTRQSMLLNPYPHNGLIHQPYDPYYQQYYPPHYPNHYPTNPPPQTIPQNKPKGQFIDNLKKALDQKINAQTIKQQSINKTHIKQQNSKPSIKHIDQSIIKNQSSVSSVAIKIDKSKVQSSKYNDNSSDQYNFNLLEKTQLNNNKNKQKKQRDSFINNIQSIANIKLNGSSQKKVKQQSDSSFLSIHQKSVEKIKKQQNNHLSINQKINQQKSSNLKKQSTNSGNSSNRVPLYKKAKDQKKKEINIYQSNIKQDPLSPSNQISLYNSNRGQIDSFKNTPKNQSLSLKPENKNKQSVDLYNSNRGSIKGQKHKQAELNLKNSKKQQQIQIRISIKQPKKKNQQIQEQNYDDDFEDMGGLKQESKVINSQRNQVQKSKFISIPKLEFIPLKKNMRQSLQSFSHLGSLKEVSVFHISKQESQNQQSSQNFDQIQMPQHSVIARPSKIIKSMRFPDQKKKKFNDKNSIKQKQKQNDPQFIQSDQQLLKTKRNLEINEKLENVALIQSTTIKQQEKQMIEIKKSRITSKLVQPQQNNQQLQEIIEWDETQSALQPLKSQIQNRLIKLMDKPLNQFKPTQSLNIQDQIKKQLESKKKKQSQITNWQNLQQQYKKLTQNLKLQLQNLSNKGKLNNQKFFRKKSEEVNLQYSKSIVINNNQQSKKQNVNKQSQTKMNKTQKNIEQEKYKKTHFARNSKVQQNNSFLQNIKQGYDVDDQMNNTIKNQYMKNKTKKNQQNDDDF